MTTSAGEAARPLLSNPMGQIVLPVIAFLPACVLTAAGCGAASCMVEGWAADRFLITALIGMLWMAPAFVGLVAPGYAAARCFGPEHLRRGPALLWGVAGGAAYAAGLGGLWWRGEWNIMSLVLFFVGVLMGAITGFCLSWLEGRLRSSTGFFARLGRGEIA